MHALRRRNGHRADGAQLNDRQSHPNECTCGERAWTESKEYHGLSARSLMRDLLCVLGRWEGARADPLSARLPQGFFLCCKLQVCAGHFSIIRFELPIGGELRKPSTLFSPIPQSLGVVDFIVQLGYARES